MDKCPTCLRVLSPSTDLTVSLDENCLIWKGIRCDLTPTETVLVHILKKSGRNWLHIDRIMSALYGFGEEAEEGILRVYFSRIRHKLRDKQIPIEIESSGVGGGGQHKYRLKKYRLKY